MYGYAGQASASGSPYRPGTADSSWEQSRPSTMGEARPDLFAHAAPSSTPSQLRLDSLPASQSSTVGGTPADVFLGANAITPRQTTFSRGPMEVGPHFATSGAMDSFQHGVPAMVPSDTPRAAHFGSTSSSSTLVGTQPTFASPTHPSVWASPVQQQSESMAYSRYAYPTQTGAGSWTTPGGMPMSMSQSVIYDSSSSTNTSPNRSQAYYDVSGDHFDHSGYSSHMASQTYPMYGPSTSKMGSAGAYVAAPQPEYQPEEIDGMLNQVSSFYKTANTKKMAEFYRDKWARMWLTCNYTLKSSIQISIPRTILHESYRRACDSFGLEPLQAASFGKVLRSQFPDVAQRRLGGRGKTRFHYCGFGTSNEREAIKVKSLLEDEKAGKLQLSAGLSAEYASEARAKARSEGHEGESSSSSYRAHPSSDASPMDGQKTRAAQYDNSPHASSESSGLGGNSAIATDDRLIAPSFVNPNSTMHTPPGTSSGANYDSQDSVRYSQVPSQGHVPAAQSAGGAASGISRRHTVSHSYSGLSDMSFLPGWHSSGEAGEPSLMHPSSDISAFGTGVITSEPAQSGSLVNSPASSLHGYQYLPDPRHVPTSMPFRRSCQDLSDWPTLPDQQSTSTGASNSTAYATGGPISNTASHESSRKAWPNHFVLE
ncbi:DNA-binding RFX-type winged-helix domain protein [Kalmanozyma brasiliensis GHG001]|uniref:DNA-binding RFX-type winged-helix domain protein n=1 Tax=Kalmanozyma brasiliensis (strain GHG001) TaxID=1365824 RepID=UPI002868254B|nr:DNA-binding RFX-type winged-helix domain protein [Kalmanozyma brasiliensis GHG001]KAF6767258.1 DNA-binding RFX-type winged-helix domain protein [Kalmanozyma brasiliensis GHG001]